ncbi:MAG: hypothetical protein Q8O57_00360 [Kiritimatiellota bacterium]|nr:hypothetical protein [Kiritimatiellota bacterium]
MIGVIIATSREAEPLLARAGVTRGREQDVPLIYDLRPARQMVICVCGMGPDRTRAGVDALLNEYDVKLVVNAGVAGAVVEGKDVGGIFRISEACLWPETKTMYACRGDRWIDLPSAVLATVDRPVFDPVWRGDIARYADVIDMECAVIAQGCQARGVPLYAIKGVTDLAGKNDRERLLANLDRISIVLAELVWREFVP